MQCGIEAWECVSVINISYRKPLGCDKSLIVYMKSSKPCHSEGGASLAVFARVRGLNFSFVGGKGPACAANRVYPQLVSLFALTCPSKKPPSACTSMAEKIRSAIHRTFRCAGLSSLCKRSMIRVVRSRYGGELWPPQVLNGKESASSWA